MICLVSSLHLLHAPQCSSVQCSIEGCTVQYSAVQCSAQLIHGTAVADMAEHLKRLKVEKSELLCKVIIVKSLLVDSVIHSSVFLFVRLFPSRAVGSLETLPGLDSAPSAGGNIMLSRYCVHGGVSEL